MRMLWLAEDCRKAGLTVVEVPGWEQRGIDFTLMPNTVVCHHTASSAKARGDLPTKKILIDGRPDLPGPLCQIGLGRNGTVYVVAAGKANHAGKGAWKGETSSARTLGIEAEHPGVGPWPQVQMDAYVLLVATLLRSIGQAPERCCGHKEWALPAGRKTDPNFDMAPFRVQVRAALAKGTQPQGETVTDDEIERVAQRVAQLLRPDLKQSEDRLHGDHVVMIRGTATGTHPFNLKSIAEKLGIKG